jgi:hypothetical protein
MTATVSDPPAIPDERSRHTGAGPLGAAGPGPQRSSVPLSCLSCSSSRSAAQTTRTTIHATAPYGVSAFPSQPGQPASWPDSRQPWRQPAPAAVPGSNPGSGADRTHAAVALSRALRHPPATAPAQTKPQRRYSSAARPGRRLPAVSHAPRHAYGSPSRSATVSAHHPQRTTGVS